MALPKHPGLLQLEDVFIENGAVCKVTKPILRGNLNKILQKSRIPYLTETELGVGARMIGYAIAALHKSGYVHGSINTK